MEISTRQIRSRNEDDEDTIEDSSVLRKTGLNRGTTSRKGFELGAESDRADASNCSYRNQDFFEKSPVDGNEAKYKDDSDYVRDSTETNSSGGSSSTSGYVPTKVRRVHRAIRNKNTGTMEVRRNPMRVKKKEMEKNFSRPRQRLLSAKRKTDLIDFHSVKRTKVSTMPYMNTRSVTRKMYNVGATYQAPTIRDETQWKEWPVHGMHERPVFHPQVGLAVEYLGKFFTSLDGLSYQEIVDPPEIEVVSVDPHCEFLCSNEKKRRKSQPSRVGCSRTACATKQDNSFVRCMHGSFHCVLGYCSQIMSPVYKSDVEDRFGRIQSAEVKLRQDEPKNYAMESPREPARPSFTLKKLKESEKPEEKSFKGNLESSRKDSIIEVSKEGFDLDRGKLQDKYSVGLSQNNPNSGQTEKPQTRHFPMYISNPQKIAFASSRTLQGGQVKSPLILLNASEAKGNIFRNRANLPKDDIQDYSQSETVSSNETSSVKTVSFKTAKRVNDFGLAKYYLGLQRTGELKGKESRSEVSKKESATTSFYGSKTWSSNETSEIARILSEYNKSNTKKPAIENLKMSGQQLNLRPDPRKEEVSYVQANTVEKNMNIKFLPGKWRRFHFTVEKLKDAKVSGGLERKVVKGIQVRQLQQKDQPGLERTATSQTKEEEHSNETKCTTVERNRRSESQGDEGGSSFQIKKEEEDSKGLVTEDDNKSEPKLKTLQDLLENTALLYCAAAGVHQDDLAEYIDSLDARQSIQWLESWKNNAS